MTHFTDADQVDEQNRDLIRPGTGTIRSEIVESAPLLLPAELSAVQFLLDERREGR